MQYDYVLFFLCSSWGCMLRGLVLQLSFDVNNCGLNVLHLYNQH